MGSQPGSRAVTDARARCSTGTLQAEGKCPARPGYKECSHINFLYLKNSNTKIETSAHVLAEELWGKVLDGRKASEYWPFGSAFS